MKKVYLARYIGVCLVSAWNVVVAYKEHKTYTELALANIKALAQWEFITWDEMMENIMNPVAKPQVGKKEKCIYYDGRGYTNSIQRSCYDIILCTDCRCTPVSCGEAFYD